MAEATHCVPEGRPINATALPVPRLRLTAPIRLSQNLAGGVQYSSISLASGVPGTVNNGDPMVLCDDQGNVQFITANAGAARGSTVISCSFVASRTFPANVGFVRSYFGGTMLMASPKFSLSGGSTRGTAVLLPGISGNSASYFTAGFTSSLVADGWQIVTADYPVRGTTGFVNQPAALTTDFTNSPTNPNHARYARRVLAWWDHVVAEIDHQNGQHIPLWVHGFSMGGWHSLYGLRHRQHYFVGYGIMSPLTRWSCLGGFGGTTNPNPVADPDITTDTLAGVSIPGWLGYSRGTRIANLTGVGAVGSVSGATQNTTFSSPNNFANFDFWWGGPEETTLTTGSGTGFIGTLIVSPMKRAWPAGTTIALVGTSGTPSKGDYSLAASCSPGDTLLFIIADTSTPSSFPGGSRVMFNTIYMTEGPETSGGAVGPSITCSPMPYGVPKGSQVDFYYGTDSTLHSQTSAQVTTADAKVGDTTFFVSGGNWNFTYPHGTIIVFHIAETATAGFGQVLPSYNYWTLGDEENGGDQPWTNQGSTTDGYPMQKGQVANEGVGGFNTKFPIVTGNGALFVGGDPVVGWGRTRALAVNAINAGRDLTLHEYSINFGHNFGTVGAENSVADLLSWVSTKLDPLYGRVY